MPKDTLRTDPAVLVTASILRESTTQDADGHYETAPTTVVASVQGDLQPIQGRLVGTPVGPDPEAEYVFVPVTRISTTIKEEDFLDVSAIRYRITFILDPGATYPQEIYLRRLTDPAP